MSQYDTHLEIGGVEDVPVRIEYTVHRFCAGATDGRHGLKISPDEPAHIEIESAKGPDGLEVELTTAQKSAVEREIMEAEEDRRYDSREDRDY